MFLAGIDLGGTFIKAGLVTEEGTVIDSITEPTIAVQGYWSVLEKMNNLIHELAERNQINTENLSAIGIGVPGTTSPEGVVYRANNLGWEDKPLALDFKGLCHKPVFIENDASMAALGELAAGCLKSVSAGILITLGTGLGTGIILEGKIFSGSHGIGRQAGHMKVGSNFYQCTCGGNGCLETFASATALVKHYKYLTGTNLAISAKEVMEAAREGNQEANEAVNRLVHYLGVGIANLINIMDPEVIALGGGLAKSGKQLLDPLTLAVQQQLYDKKRFYTRLVLSELDEAGGVIGSAMHACQMNNKQMTF